MQIAKEHIRQNILNAALPLFYAKGYSNITILSSLKLVITLTI